MKLSKIIAAAASAAALVASMSACTPSNVSDSSGNTSSESKGALAMSYAGGDITIWNDVLALMDPMAKEAGYTLLTHDPQWDVQKQVNDWDAWIARGDLKALMAFPVQNDSVIEVTSRVLEAGIPVVGYASKWQGVDYAILIDAYDEGFTLGAETGEWLVSNGQQKAKVAAIWDQATDLGMTRYEGMVAGLESTVPDIDLFALPGTARDVAFNNMTSHLVAHPDTKVVLASGDENAQGGYQALLDHGVRQDSADHLFVSLDATSNGTLDALSVKNSFWRWAYALHPKTLAEAQFGLLLAAAEGKALEDVLLASGRVDASNASDFYRDQA